MNKTLKTIGWICLALGLLGILADAGALVLGQQWIADRQTAAEEFRSALTEDELPKAGNYCLSKDEDGDGKPDSDCLQLPAIRDGFARRGGMRPGSGLMQIRRPSMGNFGVVRPLGAPIFFLTLGPILAVVGAVILLVNRTPKQQTEVPAEKNKSGKDKSKKTS